MSPEVRRLGPRQETQSLKIAMPSLTPAGDVLDEIAAHVAGTFVVVVETTSGRYRRRCFLAAASAQKAADRASAAGHTSRIYLAELRPLWQVEAAEATS